MINYRLLSVAPVLRLHCLDLLWTCRKGKLVILCFCCVFDLVDRDKSTANQKPNPIASIYCRLAWQYRVNVVSLVSNGR